MHAKFKLCIKISEIGMCIQFDSGSNLLAWVPPGHTSSFARSAKNANNSENIRAKILGQKY